jgi:fructokinase
MTHKNEIFAVIEAGGTKFNCAIVDAQRQVLAEQRIATTTPEQTLGLAVDFFLQQRQAGYQFSKLGLASFGPLDLHRGSPTYGNITSTPKPYWSDIPLLKHLATALNCQVSIDTDVNAAAVAEYRWGAAQDCKVAVYVTIGTGVGGGIVVHGKPIHGLVHPELGHIMLSPPKGIKGVCPYHGNCLEGLASGTAMGKIWQQSAESLPSDHQAWDIQAQVLANMCHTLLMTLSPQKIILGGGVMHKPGLLEKVAEYTKTSLAGYLVLPQHVDFNSLISLPGLGDRAGLFGALALVIDEATG